MATRYYDHRAMVSLTAEQADKVEAVRHRLKLKSASHAIRVMILAYLTASQASILALEQPAPIPSEPGPLDDELDTRLILGARKVMSDAIRVPNTLAPGRPNPKIGRKK